MEHRQHLSLIVAAAVCCAASAREAAGGRRLVIADVRIVSTTDAAANPRATVVVEDGLIARIVGGSEEAWKLGDELVRGESLWLMPGLIDSCVLTTDPSDLHVMALSGTTSVVFAAEAQPASEWLRPLADLPAAGLPRFLEPSSEPGRVVPTALARHTAATRWKLDSDPGSWLDLLDPSVSSRWRAQAEAALRDATSAPPVGRIAVPSSMSGDLLVPPHRAMLDELLALSASGTSPTECLRRATLDAADALGQSRLGRVEVGAHADLVLLEADPREDLTALRRVRAVVLRGTIARAAQRESTFELLKELRRDQERTMHASDIAPGSRRWLLRFDGLPRGMIEAAAAGPGDELERRVMWSPLRSELDVSMHRDGAGRLEGLRMCYRSPAQDLVATLEGRAGSWSLSLAETVDGEGAIEVPLVLPADPMMLIDFWPSVADLRWLARGPARRLQTRELVYGAGPLALSERVLHFRPWRPAAEPGERVEPRGVVALAGSVAASPWRPAAVWLLSIEEGQAGSSAEGLPLVAGGLSKVPLQVGAIGFDEEGWPLVGRIAVPEGLWEFHPQNPSWP